MNRGMLIDMCDIVCHDGLPVCCDPKPRCVAPVPPTTDLVQLHWSVIRLALVSVLPLLSNVLSPEKSEEDLKPTMAVLARNDLATVDDEARFDEPIISSDDNSECVAIADALAESAVLPSPCTEASRATESAMQVADAVIPTDAIVCKPAVMVPSQNPSVYVWPLKPRTSIAHSCFRDDAIIKPSWRLADVDAFAATAALLSFYAQASDVLKSRDVIARANVKPLSLEEEAVADAASIQAAPPASAITSVQERVRLLEAQSRATSAARPRSTASHVVIHPTPTAQSTSTSKHWQWRRLGHGRYVSGATGSTSNSVEQS